MEIDFVDTPLADILSYLTDYHGISFRPDRSVDSNTRITQSGHYKSISPPGRHAWPEGYDLADRSGLHSHHPQGEEPEAKSLDAHEWTTQRRGELVEVERQG